MKHEIFFLDPFCLESGFLQLCRFALWFATIQLFCSYQNHPVICPVICSYTSANRKPTVSSTTQCHAKRNRENPSTVPPDRAKRFALSMIVPILQAAKIGQIYLHRRNFIGGVLRGLRNISHTPVKQRSEISPVKGKMGYFSPFYSYWVR